MSKGKIPGLFLLLWPVEWKLGRRTAFLTQLICALALFPLLYTGIYNHPSGGDDYKYSHWDQFLPTMFDHYRYGGGRYFGTLMVMLSPLHWHNMTGYRIACIVLILLFIWSFYSLVRTAIVAFTNAPGYVGGAIGAITVVLLVNNMDGIAEGFFWYTGAVTHMLAAIVMACLLRLIIKLKEPPTRLQSIMAVILCIIIMGDSELTMLLCIATCLGCWIQSRRQELAVRKNLFALLLCVCILFAAISVLSPGNYLKQGRISRELAMVLPNWLYFTQQFAYKWISDPFLLAFSAVLVIITQAYPLRKPVISLFGAFLLPIGVMYLLSFPGHLALGTLFFPRIMNVIYIFFVLGWMVFVLHLSYTLRLLISRAEASASLLRQVMLTATAIALLISLNNHDLRSYNLFIIYKGLATYIPQRYSAELDARYRLVQNSGDTVVVPRLRMKQDNALYFLDITNNPEHNQNLAFARYWGKKWVTVSKDSMPVMAQH